jgi:hypothetical protein
MHINIMSSIYTLFSEPLPKRVEGKSGPSFRKKGCREGNKRMEPAVCEMPAQKNIQKN